MTTVPASEASKPSLGSTIGHGAFLACSWTWCIGMFLPVLLVRDFGVWGWVVFAVPNVLGAAAMGFFPRKDESLGDILTQHAAALRLFSFVTIAFHLFFNAWIIARFLPGYGPSMTIALAILFYLVVSLPTRREWHLAILVFAVSCLAMTLTISAEEVRFPALAPMGSAWSLACLAVSCCFGFVLCPYLDLTFHHVRRSAGAAAPAAFVVGFGLLFLAIITFSLCYAPFLVSVISETLAPKSARIAAIAGILGMYMSLQSAFTIAVHVRQLAPAIASANRGRMVLPALVAAAVAVVLGIIAQAPVRLFQLAAGEVIYRCFMAFYALYFPAYVYLRVVPRRTTMVTYALAVLLATPLFFAAFVMNHMFLLLPGLAIVLLAKLLPQAGTKSLA